VNVLCFADVEDMFEVSYHPNIGFVVHMDGKEIVFERRNKLYVAKAEEFPAMLMVTVEEKKSQFSGEQVKRAEAAYNLLKNAGYPSSSELINLVSDGNVTNMPALRREDVIRAYEIFGPPPEYIRGKLTKSKVGRVPVDLSLKADDKQQVLWSDVMHVDKNIFFVSVADLLQLLMITHLKDETANSLGEVLQGQLELMRERAFEPVMVHVDLASALMSLRSQFPGVVVDLSGAGDHVPKVDIRIRRIKEMYRTVKAGLPWVLPSTRVKDLVTYCVNRLNLRTTSALHGTLCPRVLFTGIKPSYRKELSLAFGDYVELYAGIDNTSKERSTPCIALYPVGNATGAWQFWNLRTGRYMRHSTSVKMRTNSLIVDTINAEADRVAGRQDGELELSTDPSEPTREEIQEEGGDVVEAQPEGNIGADTGTGEVEAA
jgi:hypothetical protein